MTVIVTSCFFQKRTSNGIENFPKNISRLRFVNYTLYVCKGSTKDF